MQRTATALIPLALLFAFLVSGCSENGTAGNSPAQSSAPSAGAPEVPVPGMVTMVDLGAKSCIPCKMMAPILAELEKEYEGRAAIIFIDVWEDYSQIERFGIKAIPTQIFYDKQGREVKRHVGFMDKQSIEAELKRLGVE
jgi:thioredoxin 1